MTEKKQKKLATLIILIVALTIIGLNVIQITFIAETTSARTSASYEEECQELWRYKYENDVDCLLDQLYDVLSII